MVEALVAVISRLELLQVLNTGFPFKTSGVKLEVSVASGNAFTVMVAEPACTTAAEEASLTLTSE